MDRVSADFTESTMQMFRSHVVDGYEAAEVARDLNVSPAAIYIAKFRVYRRLRESAADWIEDSAFL
ncbi:MAG: hypothetical protein CMJ78_04110 [Planctomycetaceae bacterium]|nr:hypothetical protein [Planctomycetaceae bacterium]